MLLLISPAKTLDFETKAPTTDYSHTEFLSEAHQLINQLRRFSPQDISSLMKISDRLGHLNLERFANWHTPFDLHNAKQALFAFQGDVYTGMQADTFSAEDIAFAQQHLRIISGLYGLLRPLDLIQPYRLEMGTALANTRGKNLYEFWGTRITQSVNQQLLELDSHQVINLSSNEYFGAIKPAHLHAEIITPVFKDKKAGTYKVISFFAKKARGMMSAYLIKNKIVNAELIKEFSDGGYQFNSSLSSKLEWVFTRE